MLNGDTAQTSNTIERHIDKNAFPVMTADMFREYAKNRLTAARALNGNNEQLDLLASQIDYLFHPNDFSTFAAAKQNKEAIIDKATKWFDAKEIDAATFEMTCHESEKMYRAEFDRTYKAALKKMQHVNRLLAHAVDPKKDPAKVIKKINSKADDLRAKVARPTQHHTYKAQEMLVESSHVPEGWLTREQKDLFKRVQGEPAPEDRPYTCPSTIRDKRQVGLVNALRTEIKVNGKKMFEGHRHGSPSVLKINNDAERQFRTLQNVKQSMALAAKAQIEKLASENKNFPDPLVLDMAAMSLLSPVMQGDLLDGMKQYRQVDDSRHAYWSLQGRPISIEIEDPNGELRRINVQLNSTFMSVGVNAVRGVGTPGARDLVQRVNNRGLDQLIQSFSKQIPNIDPEDKQLVRVGRRIQEIETQPDIAKYKNEIKTFDRTQLIDAYEKLEACNRGLADPKLKSLLGARTLNKERKSLLKVINKEENKLDKLYKKLAKAREEVYQDRASDLKNILEYLRTEKGYQNNKDFQKMQIFVDALDIYYNQPQPGLKRFIQVKLKTNEKNKIIKKMEKTRNWDEKDRLRAQANDIQKEIDFLNKANYRFQARFAMLASHMDQFVEWFCKSGEDRTGLLNEHIEAFCIFIEKYGYAPRWENQEDHQKFHALMPDVHNGAPNVYTNAYNDDCPGLKVSDPDFEMPTVSYYTDKKMANILKNSTPAALGLVATVKQFFKSLLGNSTIPDAVRTAQNGIAKSLVGRQPEISEHVIELQTVASKVSHNIPVSQAEDLLARERSASYTPSVALGQQTAKTPSKEHTEKSVKDPSKPGRRNTFT